MRAATKVLIGSTAGLLAAWIGWGIYVGRSAEAVPSETIERMGAIERRRYPRAVLVETTAEDARTAFGRLFEYIRGANEASESVAMTVPVTTSGEQLAMTVPVVRREPDESVTPRGDGRSERNEGAVTMAFYLPAEYTFETVPRPTNAEVEIVVEPERTLAVRRFSWYPTRGRIERQRRRLLDGLAARAIDTTGEPVLLQYNDPWTPPFMRRNEVAVPIAT